MFEFNRSFHLDTTSPTFRKDIIKAQFNNPLERVLYSLPNNAQLYVVDHLPKQFPRSWISGYFMAKSAERVFKVPPGVLVTEEGKTEANLRQVLMAESL